MPVQKVYAGDCRKVLKQLAREGLQAHGCIVDPPYHLMSIVKRFGKADSAAAKHGTDGRFTRASAGFMGKTWDGEDEPGYRIADDPKMWKLVLDCLRPGAYIIAFGPAATGHRMACAMEDAGFIPRPFIPWINAQGFPKAHAVGEDWPGWYHGGQVLNPCVEPMYVMQKPRSEKTNALNMEKHETGAMNVDAARFTRRRDLLGNGTGNPENLTRGRDSARWPTNVAHDGSEAVLAQFPEVGRGMSSADYFPSFKYHGKATKTDKVGDHPTVKPIGLLRWLLELSVAPGGLVLDPFAGTGTLGKACELTGRSSVLIERDPEYLAAIKDRLGIDPQAPPKARALI